MQSVSVRRRDLRLMTCAKFWLIKKTRHELSLNTTFEVSLFTKLPFNHNHDASLGQEQSSLPANITLAEGTAADPSN